MFDLNEKFDGSQPKIIKEIGSILGWNIFLTDKIYE